MKFGNLKNKSKKLLAYIINIFIFTFFSSNALDLSEYLTNKDVLASYNEVISDFVSMLQEEDITSPNEIFNYYNETLKKGYLSYNHQFKFDYDRLIFKSCRALSCMTGKGVCLNITGLLTDILRFYGYNAHNLYCNLSYKENNNTGIMENLISNHAITYVKYNNEYYFFDSTFIIKY